MMISDNDFVTITTVYAIVMLFIVALFTIYGMWFISQRKAMERQRDTWRQLAMDQSVTVKNFLGCCRLIDIQRNGRSNYFTFARNDDTFTIETMGLLSDDMSAWRKQAGLDQ